ncbi:helix-turn-helix domain-containing protein [Xenorhabdus sp. KJ12.1]|uniref:helix-turn-helix domain-containing protein n=1 Tax=Xenorhabdus sp. KJ12.1 TaxID=1851571 RepID=UPI000C065BA7|nr:helix-turn-helix transcriptional regulator [Xenorhabdus sp. KJ12.1]PHM67974.1 transcriptional regulator [Xenorhabdus sp. KJ12.1]
MLLEAKQASSTHFVTVVVNSQVKLKFYEMNTKRLLESRKAKGLSQRGLGEKLGIEDADIARTTISRYECGRATPSYSTVCKIADILSVPPCYFYIDDDFFAEQVLRLYKKSNTPLENELMVAKKTILQYENTFKAMIELMPKLK